MIFSFFRHLCAGMGGVFAIAISPLYRYPYRNSGEALRGDWLRIGEDIGNLFEQQNEQER